MQTTGRKDARLPKAVCYCQSAAEAGGFINTFAGVAERGQRLLDLSRLYQRQNELQAALEVLDVGIVATQQARNY